MPLKPFQEEALAHITNVGLRKQFRQRFEKHNEAEAAKEAGAAAKQQELEARRAAGSASGRDLPPRTEANTTHEYEEWLTGPNKRSPEPTHASITHEEMMRREKEKDEKVDLSPISDRQETQ